MAELATMYGGIGRKALMSRKSEVSGLLAPGDSYADDDNCHEILRCPDFWRQVIRTNDDQDDHDENTESQFS